MIRSQAKHHLVECPVERKAIA